MVVLVVLILKQERTYVLVPHFTQDFAVKKGIILVIHPWENLSVRTEVLAI